MDRTELIALSCNLFSWQSEMHSAAQSFLSSLFVCLSAEILQEIVTPPSLYPLSLVHLCLNLQATAQKQRYARTHPDGQR